MPARLLLLAVAALVVAFVPAPGPAPPAETVMVPSMTGHMLVIDYIDSRGPYRRAKVSVRSESGARTPWSGRLSAMHLEGLQALSGRDRERFAREGFRPTAEFLSSGHTTGIEILAPAPENLKRMWFRGERGSAASFRIPTRGHNPSTETDDDDDDKEPEDPDPGEGDDDGDDDDDDDDETCTGAANCIGIWNPWSCTCEPDVRDPWGNNPSSDGQATQIGF